MVDIEVLLGPPGRFLGHNEKVTMTNKRCFLSFVLLVFGVAAGAASEGTGGGFDIGPALDQALRTAILEGESQPPSSPEGDESQAADLMESIAESTTAVSEDAPAAELWPSDRLVGGFDSTSRWVTAGLALGLGTYFAVADTDDVRSLGDATQLLPGLAALGITIGIRDWDGLKQLGLASGTALVLTHGIKEVVDKTRPDTSANNSFPSGHTSASVTGAAFLWRRYGPKWGVPASVLAAYTGFSRVEGQNHFMDDVVSGMAVGLISNWLWTDPIDKRVQMALFPTRGGAGFNMKIDPSASTGLQADDGWEEEIPRRMFAWEIGASHVRRNDVVAPNPGGTPIDFRFDQENDPTVTAGVALGWAPPSMRYTVYAAFSPFEVREVVEFAEDTPFAEGLIPEGTTVQSRYQAFDYRLGAAYAVVNKPRFRLALGGSVTVFDTEVGFVSEDDVKVSEGVVVVRPVLSVSLEAALGGRWYGFARYHWWSDSDFETKDTTVQLGYRLHRKWALSLGYRYLERKVDVTELYNNVDRSQTALGVRYMW